MSTSVPLNMGKPTIATQKGNAQQQIEWRPVAEGNRLTFHGTSYTKVRAALYSVFGEFPIRLTYDADKEKLSAMAAVAKAEQADGPYQQIIQALNKFKDLELNDL